MSASSSGSQFEPRGGTETPESVYLNRRKFVRAAGITLGIGAAGGLGWGGWRRIRGTDEQVLARGAPDRLSRLEQSGLYPAPRDERFTYGRAETVEAAAARYTNFYEFSSFKWSWRLVEGFKTDPWTVTIDGLCRNPLRLDFDDLLRRYRPHLVERQYRHRCVETWAMAIPWTGFPLAALIKDADPLPTATHVRFVSFHRPDEAPGIAAGPEFPWPYTEGLTLAEAANELTLLATGMYGHPLLKQHGAPIRLVVPWKYGFKSIKSIERIELVDSQPSTFWSTVRPEAYPFQSNVEPDVPRPWPQNKERMLGTSEEFATRLYNGYAEQVGHLYRA
jgi:sulfoxide reductase catalytic subunit YedY